MLLVELIPAEFILKPPIVPAVLAVIVSAVISPETLASDAVIWFIITLPSFFKWNLEELISIRLLLPLTNWEPCLPKKNFGVSIVTELPDNVVSPVLNIFKLPPLPLMKLELSPKKNLDVSRFIDEPLR